MRGKKKYGWLSGLMSNVLGGTREYNFNNVTYIVSSQFETRSEDSHTLRSRLERLIKNNSADLSEETKGDIITAEYVSAANPISDRKEQNEENCSQTE